MASLLERLNTEVPGRRHEEQREPRPISTLESIYEAVQTLILDEHLEILRAARRGGHGRLVLERLVEGLLAERGLTCGGLSRRALVQELTSRMLGYGPLDRLLQNEQISELMVNGTDPIYVEVKGRIFKTEISFDTDQQLTEVIRRLVGGTGRRIDASSPYVDARLPDGSRLNAVLPPLAVNGPALTVRRFPSQPLTIGRLLELGTMSEPVFEFLHACVQARLNCLVSGGTATGKTTLLNILAGCIEDPSERLITLEDAAELKLAHEHRVALETRPPNVEGKGEVSLQDLLRNALRMRPDRIVIGEVRGPEAYDLIQALNTGHDGSLSTVHANSAEDALDRLESMALMAGEHVPARLVRRQLVSAVDLIVHLERLSSGRRVVGEVSLLGTPSPASNTGELVPVFRYRPGMGTEGFALELDRLPDWAGEWWRRRGLPVPSLPAESQKPGGAQA